MDLVADDAHKNLIKEVDVYNGVQSLLTRTIEQALEQLRYARRNANICRLNRKSAFNMKKDFLQKKSAINIDEYAKSISTYSDNIPEADRCCRLPESYVFKNRSAN